MLSQLEGLHIDDVTDWEKDFLNSIYSQIENGKLVTELSGKQVEVIEKIYKKHFGD